MFGISFHKSVGGEIDPGKPVAPDVAYAFAVYDPRGRPLNSKYLLLTGAQREVMVRGVAPVSLRRRLFGRNLALPRSRMQLAVLPLELT